MNEQYTTITIYSVGLLGGSLGLALKTSGFSGKVIGVSSQKALKDALALGCIDEGYGYEHFDTIVRHTDLLFLCSPITAIIETLKTMSTMELPDGLIVTDVGSTKELIVEAASNLPPHVSFIGGHPMAGSEKRGPSAADPYLFQNALYVLTPAQQPPPAYVEAFARFIKDSLGCRHIFLDASTHDWIVATVSHVPHLLAVALAALAGEREEKTPGTIQLAAGGFRDMTRIADAPFSIWRDILATNPESIGVILDTYITILQQIKDRLNTGSIEEYFEKAARVRYQIPAGKKGFIKPLSEVLVLARDEPGVIASLSAVLAEKQINIKDMEVLKVREGTGGTIRLAFDNQAVAREAIHVLQKHGFSARERE
jgi:prephenate dehydrogenase